MARQAKSFSKPRNLRDLRHDKKENEGEIFFI